MQDLINRLVQKAGLTAEQATNSLHTIKDYVKEKFPMMAGAVDNLFATDNTQAASSMAAGSAVPADNSPDFLDKISDFIPGKTGENIENLAKNAAGKAGDAIDSLKDKLGGMFDSKKP